MKITIHIVNIEFSSNGKIKSWTGNGIIEYKDKTVCIPPGKHGTKIKNIDLSTLLKSISNE